MSDDNKQFKINKCLEDLRYGYEHKITFESALKCYGGYADPQYISKETFKNFCKFIHKTNLDNEEILKNLDKYKTYENFINNKSGITKFIIKKHPKSEPPKTKVKKYTTYSAHGHYSTSNPSAILNYIAMLPAYILMMILAGIGIIFASFFNLFKSNKK